MNQHHRTCGVDRPSSKAILPGLNNQRCPRTLTTFAPAGGGNKTRCNPDPSPPRESFPLTPSPQLNPSRRFRASLLARSSDPGEARTTDCSQTCVRYATGSDRGEVKFGDGN